MYLNKIFDLLKEVATHQLAVLSNQATIIALLKERNTAMSQLSDAATALKTQADQNHLTSAAAITNLETAQANEADAVNAVQVMQSVTAELAADGHAMQTAMTPPAPAPAPPATPDPAPAAAAQ